MQAVAIYDYSQRNHGGAWLLVQVGVALRERGAVKRDSFSIVMPGGRVVPLATQEQFLADSAAIRLLQQNARIFQQNLLGYFPKSADGNPAMVARGWPVRDRPIVTPSTRGEWRPVFSVPRCGGRRHYRFFENTRDTPNADSIGRPREA